MTSEIHCDSLWHGADIVTMRDGNYHTLTDGAIAVRDGKIVWIGEHAALPPGLIADETVKFDGGIITPGFVDCHTHLVFGGNRSGEFEQRLNGVSYADIAAQGGGIISTVKATREADEALLLEQALFRLRPLLAEGVTCVEIKSGYGLSPESELKMLRVARKLGELLPVEVKTTCLAAHALPPEYANRADDYINLVCDTIIPQAAAAGLADAVDAFCEHLAFSPAQVERVFAAAEAAGLPVKLHAEQLSAITRSPPTISNTPPSKMPAPWATPAPWRCCCRAPTTCCAKPSARR
jgi:imidazolonepropionase